MGGGDSCTARNCSNTLQDGYSSLVEDCNNVMSTRRVDISGISMTKEYFGKCLKEKLSLQLM